MSVSGNLPPIDEVPAAHLKGRMLEGGWTVGELVTRDPGASGGCFSFCYSVQHEDGTSAFLKALNFQAASTDPTMPLVDRLHAFVSAYIFERDLLRNCADQRMRRIIRLIAHGQVIIPEAGPLLSEVPYLIPPPFN